MSDENETTKRKAIWPLIAAGAVLPLAGFIQALAIALDGPFAIDSSPLPENIIRGQIACAVFLAFVIPALLLATRATRRAFRTDRWGAFVVGAHVAIGNVLLALWPLGALVVGLYRMTK